MEQRTSSTARFAAALALIVAVLILIVAIASALDSGGSSPPQHRQQHAQKEPHKQRTKAKTYTVQTGDTLIAIAQKTGVPVAEIIALNPGVDPQILIAGQTLKLR